MTDAGRCRRAVLLFLSLVVATALPASAAPKTLNGETALTLARRVGYAAIAEMLREVGATQ